MQLRNKIINYYVAPPSEKGGSPRVFPSPITVPDEVATTLINKQLQKNNKPLIPVKQRLLHVCYDFDSAIIYIPNSQSFTKEQIDNLLPAAKLKITKDFGGFAGRPPIEGSPYSSLRVRSIKSFGFTNKVISEHFKGKVFKDVPVIEASLDRMPRTTKTLPPLFQKVYEYAGGYVSPSQVESVAFVEEKDIHGQMRKTPKLLLVQKPPFILINISENEENRGPTSTEKEWVVLEGYRNYLYDGQVVKQEEKYISEDLSSFADLYAIKRQLYSGWPFEDVCAYLITNGVDSFGSLMKAIERLMTAATSLAKEGYKNPASIPYWISFKIDKDFPLNITSMIKEDGTIDTQRQYRHFMVIDYDNTTSQILIRTPVFLTQDICIRLLKAKIEPFIAHYNYVANKIDIKGSQRSFDEAKKEVKQISKINSIIKSGLDEEKKKSVEFRVGELATGAAFNPNVTTLRRISDYPLAYDFIKKICKRYGVEFKDVDVLVGPLSQILGGQGTRGGFMDAKMFKQNKMSIPHEITKGIWVSPPIIMVDSIQKPSYAAQTDTLSHEYTHNIYSILHPEYEVTYNMSDEKKEGEKEYEQWSKYFRDPSEIEAHKANIEFELGSGKSYDEIIRDKVGGVITLENYPIALKFAQLVRQVMEEMEKEKEENEEPTGERN